MTLPDTIGSTVGDVAAALAGAGFDEPQRRARRLVAAALDLSASEVFSHLDRMIPAADSERVAEWLARLLAHEPLSRIRGMREFWGLEFRLSADTLDPRPETETVVEAVIARRPDRRAPYRMLDLGTGSGCLLNLTYAPSSIASGTLRTPSPRRPRRTTPHVRGRRRVPVRPGETTGTERSPSTR